MAANFLGRSGVGLDLRPRNEREQLLCFFFAALEGASSGYYHSRVNQPISAPQAFLALRAILAVLDPNLFFRFRRVERKKALQRHAHTRSNWSNYARGWEFCNQPGLNPPTGNFEFFATFESDNPTTLETDTQLIHQEARETQKIVNKSEIRRTPQPEKESRNDFKNKRNVSATFYTMYVGMGYHANNYWWKYSLR